MSKVIKFFEDMRFNFNNFLAFCILAACFAYFFWISDKEGVAKNPDIAEIKTSLITVVSLIIGYYFGSSKNSQKKDDTIQTMAENKN